MVGTALLFLGLAVRGAVPPDLGRVANALVSNLSLLFVPEGIDVMLHAGPIRRDWLPISAALVVSTLLAIAATGLAMRWLSRAEGE